MRTVRLRVQLRDVSPPVMRVLDVPAASTLDEVHLVLQAGLGWTDRHLHEFSTSEVRYAARDADDPDAEDETRVRVSVLPSTWTYGYDLGDDWTHDVEVLGAGGDSPGCVYGEGACPPEDSGGPGGYAHLLAVLDDPSDPEHEDLREWAGERIEFDQQQADERVRQVLGRVPTGPRLLLDAAAGGITLTPRGRLPRAVVREIQERRPEWYWFGAGKQANREEDLLPLTRLHDVLLETGLLRVRRGVLTPVRAAADEREVLRRLRATYASDSFIGLCAHLAVTLLLAEGARTTDELATRVFTMIGSGWDVDGRPLTEDDVHIVLSRLRGELHGLDQIDVREGRRWHPGPEARWFFPWTALVVDRWSSVR